MGLIVSVAEMQELEEAAFARGLTAEALMEEAGAGCARAIQEFFGQSGLCVAVFGKGNNGGDALVAARHLAGAGWETHLVPAFAEREWNELVRKKFGECGLARHHVPGSLPGEALGGSRRPLVVLDGLLGIGAKGALRGPIEKTARQIKEARIRHAAQVFALDVPTGLDAETGAAVEGAVEADFTLAIGAAKRGLLADAATTHVGRLVVVALGSLAGMDRGGDEVATPASLAALLPPRPFTMHKGECGRVAIVAGSRGLTGAAILCSAACARAGAGLVTLHVAAEAYEVVAAAAAPEVMVRPVGDSYGELLQSRFDVLAIGPGLGQTRRREILSLIGCVETPAVLDADALNLLASDLELLADPRAPRLLTPHPGEMARLVPELTGVSRKETVSRFTKKHPVTLLLKGARTIIGQQGKPHCYNSTGHPGMASGGMGDVLTGVCAALAGQRLSLYDAARVGAWVCGRAAELALHAGAESAESLTAPDIIAHLGRAFEALRRGTV